MKPNSLSTTALLVAFATPAIAIDESEVLGSYNCRISSILLNVYLAASGDCVRSRPLVGS